MSKPTARGLYSRMERYVDGDRRAFEELHRMLAPGLRAFLLKLVRTPSAADDLLQLTLLKAHLARDRFEVRSGDPDAAVEAWYFTISRNVAMDFLRREGRERRRFVRNDSTPEDITTSLPDPELVVEERFLEHEQREQIVATVRAAIDLLPDSQREVIELHKLRGMSMAEVAERLKVREGTLRVRAHRSYKALARLLTSSSSVLALFHLWARTG